MDRKSAIYLSLGFEIVGIVVFALYIGKAVDTHYNLNGMGTAASIGLGFVGWLTHIIVVVKILAKKEKPK